MFFYWWMFFIIIAISEGWKNTLNPYFQGPQWFLEESLNIGEPIVSYITENCNIITSPTGSRCSGQLCHEFPSEYPETNISLLIVRETNIINLKPHGFSNFTLLETLYVIKNRIAVLENDTFFGLNNLEYLNLAGNFISAIHKGAFNNLKKLKQLILVKNELTAIKPLAEALIPTLTSLEHINLGVNKLKQVSKVDFENLVPNKLKALGLMFCGITFIHSKSFNVFTSLHYLTLRKNENLDSKDLTDVFINMTDVPLQELDLTGISSITRQEHLFSALNDLKLKVLVLNAIETTEINDHMFPIMDYLEELYLNNAHIRYISDKAFHPLKTLKILCLSKNALSFIPKGLLLPQLETLDLSGFPQSSLRIYVADFIFRNMTRLERLDLSYKILLSLNNHTFVGLYNLVELSLSNCKMQVIGEGSFSHLKSLKILNLEGNQLFKPNIIINNLFFGLNSLEKLILNHNNLRFQDEDFYSFGNLFNLEYLDLSYNLIDSVNPKYFSNLTALKKISLQKNNIMGWRTRLFTNNQNIIDLDLSGNKITTVPSEMLKDFKNFNHVNLSYNPFTCNCDLLPFLNWANSTKIVVDYAIGKESYVCQSPGDVQNRNLDNIHKSLIKSCDGDIRPALLGVIASLLLLVLVAVIVGYIYRTRLKKDPFYLDSNREYQYDAFVSYSANDSEWVFSTLLPRLEDNTTNLKLCVYDRDFLAGRGISECILESIKLSRRTVLILSNHFLQSPWCRFESDLAHHTLIDEEREGLLLIKLEDLDAELITPHINYLMKVKIHLEWSQKPNEQEVFWRKLNEALVKPRKKKSGKAGIV